MKQKELFESILGKKDSAFTKWGEDRRKALDGIRIELTADKLIVVFIVSFIVALAVYMLGFEVGKRRNVKPEKDLRESQEVRMTVQAVEPIPEEIEEEPVFPRLSEEVTVVEEPSGEIAGESEEEKLDEIMEEIGAATDVSTYVPSEGEKYYTFQLITYVTKSRAEREIAKLRDKGMDSFLVTSGKYFMVCAEKFKTRDEAKEKLNVLKGNGSLNSYQDAFIRIHEV